MLTLNALRVLHTRRLVGPFPLAALCGPAFPQVTAERQGEGMRSNSSAQTRWWAALGASQR
ncbi:MAG TPA: hypothetical protein VG673_07505, partial [Actinomycetota bacterium]|nr:hypothetical protein [Actinomycetota bacterium]